MRSSSTPRRRVRAAASPAKSTPRPGDHGVTFEEIRRIALALPGAPEGTSYGTPAFRVSGKFLARLHDDGVSLVLKVDPDARDILLQAQPETFYITDHYAGSPAYILVRIAAAHPSELARMFEEAWRNAASRRLIATRDGAR